MGESKVILPLRQKIPFWDFFKHSFLEVLLASNEGKRCIKLSFFCPTMQSVCHLARVYQPTSLPHGLRSTLRPQPVLRRAGHQLV